MGATLAELIVRHNVEMTPVYTHSAEATAGEWPEHDVYDCFLTIEGGVSLYGGRFNTRTLLIRGYGQSFNNSRPQNGDELVPPTTSEVILDRLLDSYGVDANGDFDNWFSDRKPAPNAEPLLKDYREWESMCQNRDELAVFLGEHYEEFKDAAINE